MSRIHTQLLAIVTAVVSTSGCYTSSVTTTSQVTPGMDVVLTISDAGRSSLGPRIGEGVLRVTGKLAERTDTTLSLRVSTVEYLGGAVSPWDGQPMTLHTSHVGAVTERRFSKGRTWTAAGAVVGGLVAIIAATDFFNIGSGGGTTEGNPPINP